MSCTPQQERRAQPTHTATDDHYTSHVLPLLAFARAAAKRALHDLCPPYRSTGNPSWLADGFDVINRE
jgi:hypothetical protein